MWDLLFMGIIRKAVKIIWYAGLTIAALLCTGLLLLQIPAVQTRITAKIADYVSENVIDADIHFGKLHLNPFNTLIIKDITVIDKTPYVVDTACCSEKALAKLNHICHCPVDTLFTAENIIVKFSLKGLLGNSICIGGAAITGARLNLVLEEGDNSTNLTRMFRIPEGRKRQVEDKEIFHVKDIVVENLRFTMKDYTVKHTHVFHKGIDWSNMDVRNICIKGRHLRLRGKVMSGELDMLSFNEKSGYVCHSISGRTRVGRGKASIEDFRLSDPWSKVYISSFNMLYEKDTDFADFIHKVRLEATVRQSRIGLATISYFAPALEGNSLVLDVDGMIAGTVDNLSFNGFHFSTEDGSVSGNILGGLSGLPESGRIKAMLMLKDFHFNAPGIAKVAGEWSGSGKAPEILELAGKETFTMNGKISGRIDHLNVTADVRSSAGALNADMDVKGLLSESTCISGTLGTDNLNIRKIMAKVPVGPVTLDAGLSAEFGQDTSVKIDSMKVSRFNFNNYDYSGIAAAGIFRDNRFDGKVVASDPNLNFLFQGIFSLPGKGGNATYRFYANVGHADLNALQIDGRGRSEIRLQTIANFVRNSRGDMTGDIEINDIFLTDSNGQLDIGDIKISSKSGSDRHRIDFSSKFAEGTYSGSAPPTTFVKDIVEVTAKREMPALFKDPEYKFSGNSYKLNFRTLDMMDILSFIAPGMYIADNSTINADISPEGILTGTAKSQRIAFKEQYVKDMEWKFNNIDSTFTGEASGSEINVAGLMIRNNRLKIFADGNHVGAGFAYDNPGNLENKGEIVAFGNITRDDDGKVSYKLGLLPSSVYLNSREWNIYPSEVTLKGKELHVDNVEIRSGEQAITASGGLSENFADTLDIRLDRFDMSVLNPITGNKFNLKGAATGTAKMTSPASSRGIIVDFICDSTEVGSTYVGDIAISSRWNQDFKRFDISAANSIDGRSTFDIKGNYSNSRKHLEMAARLDSMDIGFAQPFLEGIFSGLDGHISGLVRMESDPGGLSIDSRNTYIDDLYMKVAYTNVGYNAKGAFHIDDLGIYFDDIDISDRYGNSGKVTGKIGYDHFRNMNFDIGINVNRIEAIDLDEKDSDLFYGHLFASGDISVTGPLNSITLTADAMTSREGNIHIPISSPMIAGTTNLLKFKDFTEHPEDNDPYDQMMHRLKAKTASGGDFALKLKISTNPEVDAFVEIDKASGNVLNGKGNGTIDLDINPGSGRFDIKGDYTITSGNFHFVALGIAARDFIINEGSNIRFNGDIMESTLNINATYRTKASLATLISDTTSVNNRRIVECGIKITDKLRNPRLSFSINIPDLDPMIKARVENALSTEDKVQKQFLSLLISNGFLPDEQSGIVNNTTALYSNVSELMVSQLNNIFQKLDIPLDLGLNYQQNTRGDNIFDVAVSTQLFNNRVIVNGNIGNRQYRSSSSGSEVAGDIDIEIKLDRPGAFRLNLFSHSADQYTNYLDNSQRNGIGITYQQEFNRFGQFVRRAFMGRKKREIEEFEDIKKAQSEERVKIIITPDDNKRKK